MFYPEWSKNDVFLTEFLCSKNGNQKLVDNHLDPEEIRYAFPDFGFDSTQNFQDLNQDNDYGGKGWQKFMDCVSLYPKHERVKNYVNFINQKKIQLFEGVKLNTKNPQNQDYKRLYIEKLRDRTLLGLPQKPKDAPKL